ncbi:MAG: 16S rRNA (cytosine(1402)-N(4))-methyltransferase RsmH, partial [Clostridia bacterium]|nr:16S rRNA (cytosine(1402)-N(4))-methyltransferase RsmH [Clostridia bacterium]
MKDFAHIPVMLNECIKGLNVKDGGIYFDGTVGGAGHSYEILKKCSPTGKLIATDLDEDAIAAATERLAEFKNRFKIYKSDYKNFAEVLNKENIDLLDGALLDFGVSSYQLDCEERGFSYMKPDAPLDMRMDKSAPLTAEMLLNEYPQNKISKILKIYGEEKFATQIAANIVKERTRKPLKTCGELVNIIERSIPAKFKLNGPCSRKSFQAIRIAVNGELDGLYDCVLALTRRLKRGGRIAILTFHSLEDRIVKQGFKLLDGECVCDKSLPV